MPTVYWSGNTNPERFCQYIAYLNYKIIQFHDLYFQIFNIILIMELYYIYNKKLMLSHEILSIGIIHFIYLFSSFLSEHVHWLPYPDHSPLIPNNYYLYCAFL